MIFRIPNLKYVKGNDKISSLCGAGPALYIKGNDVTMMASMAKLKGGRLAREVSDGCLQYWGGMGFTSDVLVSRFYRYVLLIFQKHFGLLGYSHIGRSSSTGPGFQS